MSNENEIRGLLARYETSLNESDAHAATDCYAADGVFMATGLPTAAGDDLMRAYEEIFRNIRLSVIFTIDELVVASPEIAYAMTRSNGTQTILATGMESAESNRELFVFGKEQDSWKIKRYLFNKPE